MQHTFPFFLFGDPFICSKIITDLKKDYLDSRFTEIDLCTESLDYIRSTIGTNSLDETENIVIIKDLSIKKALLEFLLDICASPTCSKIIIWDSANLIKPDPKTGTLNKTWSDFLKNFKLIKGVSVIHQQDSLDEKKKDDAIEFIISRFLDFSRTINDRNADLLLHLVGFNRTMLNSEIEKLVITCPNPVTSSFIIENVYITSKESLLFKFANVLNEASYEEATESLKRFMDAGFSANELIVVLLRQARWQLIATYLWCKGYSWQEIPAKLMQMGKMPALIWHNSKLADHIKEKEEERCKDVDSLRNCLVTQYGLPKSYIKQGDKINKPEVLPHPIIADQIVWFLESKILPSNQIEEDIEAKKRLFNRSLKVYTFIAKKLEQVRYNVENATQDLYESIKVITNTDLDNF